MVTISWPATAVVTGDLVTSLQLNGLPVLIANSTLSADAATVTFSSISGHYAHLMLECYVRADTATSTANLQLKFNGDGGANYDYQWLYGNAATVTAIEIFADTSLAMGNIPANTAGANLFGDVTIDIPHYANATNNKDAVSANARKIGTATGNLIVFAVAGFWRSTAAITSVTVAASGGNLRAGSRVTLYGLP